MVAAPLSRRIRVDDDVEALGGFSGGAESLLPILQEVQRTRHEIRPSVLGAICDKLQVGDAQAYGVATFYSMLSLKSSAAQVLRVCDGPVCALHGCQRVGDELRRVAACDDRITVERTSCLGLCDRAPAVLVNLEPCGPVAATDSARVLGGWRGDAPDYGAARPNEVRVALKRIGTIDPWEVDEALAAGAYQSLAKALRLSPAEVLQSVMDSGLQGRGGAGFPTGSKWRSVADTPAAERFIVCNADESEPMTFKDRVLMEGDPHLLLEGMALAGYAVGARRGLVYIRGEYEGAARRLERGIEQAEGRGWLGESVQGTSFDFRIQVHRGAGAYICGEETALLESLEGRRGEPRIRPPFPATHGYRGLPTVVNNVETLCKVPAILEKGADWYRSMGTPQSPGTKIFTVTGHVRRPGAFETPFGVTLREVIDQFAGGMMDGAEFQAAVTGGAAGTIVGSESLDVPLDFASHHRGVAIGSGGILIVDQSTSIAALLCDILRFFEVESCGKCTPCREGTREARQIVERWRDGRGRAGDVDQLRRLSRLLRLTSLCGLGQSVAWPIDSALANFENELAADRTTRESS